MQTLGIVGPGSVLDSKLVMENEKDGDMGADWLNTNSAGSGMFGFEGWKANDRVILTRNDDFWGEPSAMKRIIMRHIPESQNQRLMLEKGDIDIGFSLAGPDLKALSEEEGVEVISQPGSGFYYLAVSMKDERFANPEGARGAALPDRLPGDQRGDHALLRAGASAADRHRLPRGAARSGLHARRREGEGAAGRGRLSGRLQGQPAGAGRRAVHERGDRDPGDAGAGRHRGGDHLRLGRAESTVRCASATSSCWSAVAAAGSCRTRTRTCGRWSTTPTTATRRSSPTSRAGGPRSSTRAQRADRRGAGRGRPGEAEGDVPGASRSGSRRWCRRSSRSRRCSIRSPTAPTSKGFVLNPSWGTDLGAITKAR